MSAEDNKAVVGRWFTEVWGNDLNPAVIDDGVTVLRQVGPIREA